MARLIPITRPDRDIAGSAEGATINVSRLNLDSSGAYAVASHTAEASHIRFATADYVLRTDDRGEPMWIVTLRNSSSHPIGTIYVGGTRGTVRRTEGMFAGATMEDVEGDYDQGDGNRRHQGRETIDQARFQQSTGRSPRNVRESEAVIFRFH